MAGGEPVNDTLRQSWLDYRRMLDEALVEIRQLRSEKEHLARKLFYLRRHGRARALPLAIMLEAAKQMHDE